MAIARHALLGITLLASAHASAASQEAIYFAASNIRVHDTGTAAFEDRSFTAIRMDGVVGGERRLRTRVIWSEQRGTGFSANSLRLNPNAADDGSIAALLHTGFEMTLTADGAVRDVRAVDPSAWQHAVKHTPQLAAQLASQRRVGGLTPTDLPVPLRIGQKIVHRDASTDIGDVTVDQEVLALTDRMVLLDVVVSGSGVSGKGRQVLQRADGMPVEARYALSVHEQGDTPALEMDLYVARMSTDPMFDAGERESRQHYNAMLREQIERPPFSSPSNDPDAYPQAVVDLIPAEVFDRTTLAEFEAGLQYSAEDDHHAARPLIRLNMSLPEHGRPAATDSEWFPMMAWLRRVELLDAKGRPLPGLQPVPVVQRWLIAGASRTDENDVGFPFRLPINTRAGQLDGLSAIRLAVDLERYTKDAEERLPRGQQSMTNARMRITWASDQRATLVQAPVDKTEREGVWTTAIALDAQGKSIPIALVPAPRDATITDAACCQGAALEWERDREPERLEIAAAAPIHALLLQHYRWKRIPRDWMIRKVQTREGAR